jgi:hypothetical protein
MADDIHHGRSVWGNLEIISQTGSWKEREMGVRLSPFITTLL